MTRTYRIRLYDGSHRGAAELLAHQVHAINVDLAAPGWPAILTGRLAELVEMARESGEHPEHRPRLELLDWETGEHVLDWAG